MTRDRKRRKYFFSVSFAKWMHAI